MLLAALLQLCQEFDRAYTEMAEANKLQYNAYFTQVLVALSLSHMYFVRHARMVLVLYQLWMHANRCISHNCHYL